MVDVLEQAEIEFILNKINYILQSMSHDDTLTTLQETDLLFKILPKKKRPDLIMLEEKVRNILLDNEEMRIIKLLRKVKEDSDSGAEYYDADRGNDKKLFYAKEHENKILILFDEIRTALAVLIKEKIGEMTL